MDKHFACRLLAGVALLGLLAACSGSEESMEEADLTASIREAWGDQLIPLSETPPYPPDNGPHMPGYAARVELGRMLFFDPILSGHDDISCGHCHHPALAWGDARALSIGVGGVGLGPDRVRTLPPGEPTMEEWEFMMPRNTPSSLDLGRLAADPGQPEWESVMFWDGREVSLEKQSRRPPRTRDEMKHDAYGDVVAFQFVCQELRAVPEYVTMFAEAFPEESPTVHSAERRVGDVISAATYSKAISAYQRELYTEDSPYDRFARGDDTALTTAQKRGLKVFFEAGCGDCHNGPMLADGKFHALGVAQGGGGHPPLHEHGDGTDQGRFVFTTVDADRYAFRTPTLRNVSLTFPYFHTGGQGTGGDYQTLRQVVEFFNRGGNDLGVEEKYLHPYMVPLGLTDAEIDDLVAFMESLTGARIGSSIVNVEVPAAVPSGIPTVPVIEPVIRN